MKIFNLDTEKLFNKTYLNFASAPAPSGVSVSGVSVSGVLSNLRLVGEKSDDSQSDKITLKTYFYDNMWLIAVVMTFLIFNFFKDKFFEGKFIQIVELFYMTMSLFIAFYFTTSNKCSEKTKTDTVSVSLQNALIMSLFVALITRFNPFKSKMSATQLNALYIVAIITFFNVMLYIINNDNYSYCSQTANAMIYMLVLILHFGNILTQK